jgi:hypothetical protein
MILDMAHFPPGQLEFCNAGRPYFDYDVIDENMIEWAYLSRYKILLHTSGTIYREQTLLAIGKWLHAGGVLVTAGPPQWSDLDGHKAVAQGWLANENADSRQAAGVRLFSCGKGRIYVIDASSQPDYLGKVVAVLAANGTGRPAEAPLRGFKAKDDGTYITDFPSGRLVFDTKTLDTTFVPASKRP